MDACESDWLQGDLRGVNKYLRLVAEGAKDHPAVEICAGTPQFAAFRIAYSSHRVS